MSYGTYCLICFFSLNNRSWKLFYIRTYSANLFFEFSIEYFIGWICRSSFYCSNIAGHLDCFCFLPLQITLQWTSLSKPTYASYLHGSVFLGNTSK